MNRDGKVEGVGSRPFVTIHVAQSLDGRLGIEGSTTLLSTPEGRAYAHAARAAHDAVLVGSSTVRIDDPRLTVRAAKGADPLRVVLSSTLAVPRNARVLAGPHSSTRPRTLVIGAEGVAKDDERRALEAAGVAVAIAPKSSDGRVSIEGALAILAERGVQRLLVEGGGKVVTSFLSAHAVDAMSVEISVRMLGAPGTPMLGPLGIDTIGEAPALANVVVERLGSNVLVRGDVVHA